jgi:hypothetical protein
MSVRSNTSDQRDWYRFDVKVPLPSDFTARPLCCCFWRWRHNTVDNNDGTDRQQNISVGPIYLLYPLKSGMLNRATDWRKKCTDK